MNRCDFESFSKRSVSERSTSGVRSLPDAANSVSRSSGIEFQNKYDSRQASAWSSTWPTLPASATRYRKSGEHNAARYAQRIAVSKLSPAFKRSSTLATYARRTSSETGRRNAFGKNDASKRSASTSG